MRMMITYMKDNTKVRLLGVYSEGFSLERKADFKPVARTDNLDALESFVQTSPLVFCNYFFTDINTDLDEHSFVQKFSSKLSLSVTQFGDEKTISALSMGK